MNRPPKVTIVGLPNVGKSTLMNALVGRRVSITDDRPGVTRDAVSVTISLDDARAVELVDTGGYLTDARFIKEGRVGVGGMTEEGLLPAVWRRVEAEVDESDLVLFVIDGSHPLTSYERSVMAAIRKRGRPILFVINKADQTGFKNHRAEWDAIDGNRPVIISAERRTGIEELKSEILRRVEPAALPAAGNPPRVAIVGRPNVGKSLLINRLLNDDRMIVSDMPGTTRDSVDSRCRLGRLEFILTDTAGLRKKSRVKELERVEGLSTARSLNSIERADLVLLVVDAEEPFTHQDVHLASHVARQEKPCIILINKWDLLKADIPKELENSARDHVRHRLGRLRYAPIHMISAKTGYHLKQIPTLIGQVLTEWNRSLSTRELNRFLREVIEHHSPPRGKVYYIAQPKSGPPLFYFSASKVEELKKSLYPQYLENALRDKFGFMGVPIRMRFRDHHAR